MHSQSCAHAKRTQIRYLIFQKRPKQMARIQDIKQFEELIYDTVDEYLQEMDSYDHPVLAIWREDGEHQVVIDEPSNLPLSDDMEQYELDALISQTDAAPEPNLDRISEIANEWIFPD